MTSSEWESMPYDQRLLMTEFIFRKINSGPQSFRSLIYEELGFDGYAYELLYKAGGMNITNCMQEEQSQEI